jgi:hypothetical protein
MEPALSKEKNTARLKERSLTVDVLHEEPIVEDFISKFMFFPPRIETAAKILRLNEALSDNRIEKQLDALPEDDLNPPPEGAEREVVVSGSWLSAIVERVSSILFHGDEPDSEQAALSEAEMVSLFQKTLSERIYNRLSMISDSPHARKGRHFSIKEELTKGIAVNIGLGLYRYPETPDHLREEAAAALLELAGEFQGWLLHPERGGIYNAPWGQVRAIGTETPALEVTPPVVVWMVPDVESQAVKSGQEVRVVTRRFRSNTNSVPNRLVAAAKGRD